jgi:uncharacterized membrane protein
MNFKGQSQIVAVGMAGLLFLLVMFVYGNFQAAANINTFTLGTRNLINLLPMVVVAGALVGLVIMGMRLSN